MRKQGAESTHRSPVPVTPMLVRGLGAFWRYTEPMCGTSHLLTDGEGTPPWRMPGVRTYMYVLGAFAAFDVLLVAFNLAL